jgi:hypothetical protein
MRIRNPEPNESCYWLDFSEHLPKAVAREDHMMTSCERRMAAGMARPRAAAKLPQNGIRICIQPKMVDPNPDQMNADPQP